MARLQVELIKKRIDFIKNLNQKVTSIYNLIAKNDNEKLAYDTVVSLNKS